MSHQHADAGSRRSATPKRRAPTRRRAPANPRTPRPPGTKPAAGGPDVPDFDTFYMATRRRLLLQALALSGNMSTARHAVRQAFIAAQHHWHKVRSGTDPEAWVRQRVCATANRVVIRTGRTTRTAGPEQAGVLAALSGLTALDRAVVVVFHLGRVSIPEIGRQLAMRSEVVAERLTNANAQLSSRLDCAPADVRAHLESLAPMVASPGLPHVAAIRRRGVRRRRWHIVGGTVVAVSLMIGAGWLVSTHAPAVPEAVRKARSHPVSAAMLISPAMVHGLGRDWTVSSTHMDAATAAPTSVCQGQSFADPHALRTAVRTLTSAGRSRAVQSVEVSSSAAEATAAFATALRWYAGCARAGVHLQHAYRMPGVGDDTAILDLTAPTGARYLVAITRSGQVTSLVVMTTRRAGDSTRAVGSLATAALGSMCPASAIGPCASGPVRLVDHLPVSGEAPGMLATVDMPVLTRIKHAWVGTDPVHGGPNLAATTCDRSTLTGQGRTATSRTFLIPQAKLPTRFGLTEVTTDFGTARAARSFLATVAKRMRSCEHRQLGTSVRHGFTHNGPNASYAGWWVSNEINSSRTRIHYWMGVARVGSRVAQVGFAPAGKATVAESVFAQVMSRTGERLAQAPR